jgi:hypothetical protein
MLDCVALLILLAFVLCVRLLLWLLLAAEAAARFLGSWLLALLVCFASLGRRRQIEFYLLHLLIFFRIGF